MKWFAYLAEVHIEGDWAAAFLLVSPAGVGMRHMLEAIREGKEDECRSRRILYMKEFEALCEAEIELGIAKEYSGERIEFSDGEGIIDPQWVGLESWDTVE